MAVVDRIVSLLPSATEIVCALGLAHHLVGVVMPCGFELAAARADADACRAPLDAVAPRAVRSGRAYAVDATAHFRRPGPRVADGVELLAALLHPDVFPSASLEGRATVWA